MLLTLSHSSSRTFRYIRFHVSDFIQFGLMKMMSFNILPLFWLNRLVQSNRSLIVRNYLIYHREWYPTKQNKQNNNNEMRESCDLMISLSFPFVLCCLFRQMMNRLGKKGAWCGLVSCMTIILFNGFGVFIRGNWSLDTLSVFFFFFFLRASQVMMNKTSTRLEKSI